MIDLDVKEVQANIKVKSAFSTTAIRGTVLKVGHDPERRIDLQAVAKGTIEVQSTVGPSAGQKVILQGPGDCKTVARVTVNDQGQISPVETVPLVPEEWPLLEEECGAQRPPQTFTVCPSGCRYSAISQAITEAQPGAIITIGPGTYTENLEIRKSITLRGAGREQTQIQGKDDGKPVINIIEGDPEVVLEGLTVAEAKGTACAKETYWWLCPYGIQAGGRAKVTLQNVRVTASEYGLFIGDSAQVNLVNSQVDSHRLDGLVSWGTAGVEIKDSVIERNGTDPACAGTQLIPCSGITVNTQSRTTISDSVIRDNTDWGVDAVLKRCGYAGDFFNGEVVFQGTNTIEGNNKSGNHSGQGNPGNHPFTNLPDGQVCLP